MQVYFAPLEGITDHIYRQLHHRYFPGINKYFTPFFSPTVHRSLTPKEARELPQADTLHYTLVPQILTNHPENFLWMAHKSADLGYQEINLNLGCPSGTVTAKKKGSGMLQDTEALCRFLDAIFHGSPIDISLKTRIGFSQPEEFPKLLEIYNRYPVKELIIHPRTRSTFYNGAPDMDAFTYAIQNAKAPICYNGNLCSATDIENLCNTFPQVQSVMLGRGLIGDPGMLSDQTQYISLLQDFYSALLEEYIKAFGGSRNAMFRLKENWRYLICRFQNTDKLAKRLRKTTDIQEYKAIVNEIFMTCPLQDTLYPDW